MFQKLVASTPDNFSTWMLPLQLRFPSSDLTYNALSMLMVPVFLVETDIQIVVN